MFTVGLWLAALLCCFAGLVFAPSVSGCFDPVSFDLWCCRFCCLIDGCVFWICGWVLILSLLFRVGRFGFALVVCNIC